MSGVIVTNPKVQFLGANGAPLVGGTLTTYLAGTTTPTATYQDEALTAANTNPIVLDARGECLLWLDSTKNYKFVLANSSGVVQWTVDDISGADSGLRDALAAANGASLIGYTGPAPTSAVTTVDQLAATGTNKGADLVGFLQAGNLAVPTTVQAKLRETVSVLDFGADPTGGTDSTAAVQATIDALPSIGGTVRFIGNVKFGALTIPNKPIRFEIDGQITLTTTLTLPSTIALIGVTSSANDQFGRGSFAKINPPAGNIPTIRVIGSANHLIENIRIDGHEGVGIELDGETSIGALCILRNVSCYAKPGTPTALPLKVKTWFWLWVENCAFYSFAGCAGYSILFTQENIASGGYTGLCFVNDTILNAHGIGIKSTTNALMCPFEFRRIGYENCLTDGITIEKGTGGQYISHITIDDFELQDPINPVSLVRTIGPGIRGIRFENNDLNARYFAAGSSAVEDVIIEGRRWFPYTTGIDTMPPVFTQHWTQHYGSAIDAVITTAAAQPSMLPFEVLPVNQTASTWVGETGGVVTAGKLAPDGTLTAAEIGGANGGLVRVYEAAASITLGDWIIGGVWVRGTEVGKPTNRALLLMTDSTVRLNDSGISYKYIVEDSDHARVNDNAWKFVSFAVKVTNAGTGTSNIRFSLYNQTSYGGVSEWWMPCLAHVPASANLPDWEAVRMARSIQAFPRTGEAGTYALLPHQLFQLGGGVRQWSASAAPVSGTWKRGDIVWNTTPSAGGTPGWMCVSAGTPGTWKAMANLAS